MVLAEINFQKVAGLNPVLCNLFEGYKSNVFKTIFLNFKNNYLQGTYTYEQELFNLIALSL